MIYKVAFTRLLVLLNVLQARTGTRTKLGLRAASVAALTIILRYITAKQSKLITDYAKVARKIDDNGREFDEWEFVIVGGGMIYC
jgi:choline dehydrogenase